MKKMLFIIALFLVYLTNISANETLDLSPYSNMDLNVYQNSRVTSITANRNGTYTLNKYMFEDGVSTTKNSLWREIIFVNVNNPSTEYAWTIISISIKGRNS